MNTLIIDQKEYANQNLPKEKKPVPVENNTSNSLMVDANNTGGLLNIGYKINGYVVKEKLNVDTGEAEIYFCEKDSKKYILKYYKTTILGEVAEKLKSIKHKNVMRILECGKTDDTNHSYEIDEFCEGGILEDALPLSGDEAKNIIRQINEGLKAIHDAELIHRDIKAENIYFRDKDRKEVVIGDFGTATVYDTQDDVNEHLTKVETGTDGYKAPESFNGLISPAVDYYALGIVTWHILTGKEPFESDENEAFNSARIRYETIEGKVKDYLFSKAIELDNFAKKLVNGLLVYRHDQRWGYGQVADFLNGKPVEVFEENRDWPEFEIGGSSYYNPKDIAAELLKNKEEAVRIIKESHLHNYLQRNSQNEKYPAITHRVAALIPALRKIIADYFSERNSEAENYLGVIEVAFLIYEPLSFVLHYGMESVEIKTLSDFIDVLNKHPYIIIPYLRDDNRGLYVKLKTFKVNIENSDESFSETVKSFVNRTKDDRTLCTSLYVYLIGNKISPFTDKQNMGIELHEQSDLYNLKQHLKDRFMFLVDAKDKYVIAWLENVFGCNMSEWYGELEGGVNNDWDIAQLRRNKLLAYGKWRYFELFLQKKDLIRRKSFIANDKIGLLDLGGSELLPARYENVVEEFVRNEYIIKEDGKWKVRKSDKYILESDYISVFDEENEIYLTIDENGNHFPIRIEENGKVSHVFIEGNQELRNLALLEGFGLWNREVASCSNSYECEIGRISAIDEKNRPKARYVNSFSDVVEINDEDFNIIGEFEKVQAVPFYGAIPNEINFWVKDRSGVAIVDRNCKEICRLRYSDFSPVGNNCFIAKDDSYGRHDLLDYKQGQVIFENVDDFRSSGSVCAVMRRKKWEILSLATKEAFTDKKYKFAGNLSETLFVCNNAKKYFFFTEHKNTVNVVRLSISGKSGQLYDSRSNKIGQKMLAVNTETLLNASKDPSQRFYHLLCFDGNKFFRFNFSDNTFCEITTLKQVAEKEMDCLLDNVDSKRIVKLVKSHIQQGKQTEANKIINVTCNYYKNNNFNVARYLLSSIRMDKMDGFDMPFLYYKNMHGMTFMNENQLLEKATDPKLVKRRCDNYIFALHYMLSSAGKEIVNGEIVTAPYFARLRWNSQLHIDCIETCIRVYKTKDALSFDNGWTKGYIKTASAIMTEELFNFFTNESNISDETYLNINRVGKLFMEMEEYGAALKVFEEGMKHEWGDVFPVSTLFVAQLKYGFGEYKEAYVLFKKIDEFDSSYKEQNELFNSFYIDCKKKLGLAV